MRLERHLVKSLCGGRRRRHASPTTGHIVFTGVSTFELLGR
jgi:hypothetical protein